MVRLRRSVSHVVGHGHLLTSGWVPSGPVGVRRGSLGTRMGPDLSRTLIRVHRVIRQGSSGPIGSRRDISATSAKVPVRSKNIKFGPKWVENQPFGSKQRPNEPNRLSGPIQTTPEAKNNQKIDFFMENGSPRPPADLGVTPIGAGWGLRIFASSFLGSGILRWIVSTQQCLTW